MFVRGLASLVLLAWAVTAHAGPFPMPVDFSKGRIQEVSYFVPENGWWIIEDKPGTGFAMERQAHPSFGDIIFMAVFTYDTEGRPTFYTASLRYDSDTKRASEMFTRTLNGQVFDDPEYRFPDVEFGIAGDAVFEFDSPTTGRWISTAQGEVPIVRQDFGYENLTYERMTGRWLITYIVRIPAPPGLPVQGQWYQDTRSYIIDFDERVAAVVFQGAEPFISLATSPVRWSAIATAQTVNLPPEPGHTVRIAIADLYIGSGEVSAELFFRPGIDYMTGVYTGFTGQAVATPRDRYTTAYAVRLGTRHEIPPIALPGSGAEAELKALASVDDELGAQIQAMRGPMLPT